MVLACTHLLLGMLLAEDDRLEAAQHQYDKGILQYKEASRGVPQFASTYNNAAWPLAVRANLPARVANLAVEWAEKAVELGPERGNIWNTLGAAQYRAGKSQAAVQSLQESMRLGGGGQAYDFLFLAMAHWQLGEKQEAHRWYDKAVEWIEQNKLEGEEYRRFRAEAAELLGMDDAQAQTDPSTNKQPQEFTDHMIFPWSAWEDCIW